MNPFATILRLAPYLSQRLNKLMPGLSEIAHYQRAPLKSDLTAGLSVAAVALPTSIAYAQLAGFSPEIGLYSTILPMIVYAFFGSSRQLIVGPDAATCAMITASLTPLVLAEGITDPEYYHALAVSLTAFTGLFCLLAARFRLGFLADLLSRSVLMGLLNGVALTIIIGQLGKVVGVATSGKDNIGILYSFLDNLSTAHLPTLLLTLLLLLLYVILRRRSPRLPLVLILAAAAMVYGSLISWSWLSTSFVRLLDVPIVGEIPSSMPTLHLPAFPHQSWGTILPAAMALAFISFSSATLTGRSFAAKNGYEIDSNHELTALGAANLASAFSQGFAISGADSRTAVNDAAGGKTRMAQIFAALAILIALLVLSVPLSNMPVAALGMILIISAVQLTDFKTLFRLHAISRNEFYIAFVTFLAVLLIGVMQGIFLAVMLAILRFLRQTARPSDHRIGYIADSHEFRELDQSQEAKEIPGLLFYRFEASLIFINANYFRQRVMALIQHAETPVRWLIIDGRSMNNIDLTGAMMLNELSQTLRQRGITVALSGRTNQFSRWQALHPKHHDSNFVRLFRDRHAAFEAFNAEAPELASSTQFGPFTDLMKT